jgi:Phasin protein
MSMQSSVKARRESPTDPPFVFGIWNPFFIGATASDESTHEALRPLICEWQDFVARRLKEDSTLMQNLAHSKSPNDVWSAYSDFWRKAVEDYGKELATMNRLLVGATNKMVAATQHTTEYAGRNVLSARRDT